MEKISFTKMVANGNDFVVVDSSVIARRHKVPTKQSKDKCDCFASLAMTKDQSIYQLPHLVQKICDRKYGIGADGLLVLEKSKIADIKMRIFNADGSEAQMCGNGARCVAFYLRQNTSLRAPTKSANVLWRKGRSNLKNVIASSSGFALLAMTDKPKIETKAGIIASEVTGNNVRIKLSEPSGLKLDIPISIKGRRIRVNFINTGVPHTVIFVEGVDSLDVRGIGSRVRYHREFIPTGTNVDFVEILSKDSIKVRTYERGVEDETLACGTGATASALLSTIHHPPSTIHSNYMVNVLTKSGEKLRVYFERRGNNFSNVWLEGKAGIVYKGEYYV